MLLHGEVDMASWPLIDCNLRVEVRDILEDCKQLTLLLSPPSLSLVSSPLSLSRLARKREAAGVARRQLEVGNPVASLRDRNRC